MLELLGNLLNNNMTKALAVVIVFDTVFGILRAIREKEINSTIGIDGIIRKTGMCFSIVFLKVIDYLLSFNLIGFLPEEILEIIHMEQIGLGDLFNILFICFEFLSVLKNMVLCKMPVVVKFQDWLENIMNKFTKEIRKDNK